jgi:hypothetical protein
MLIIALAMLAALTIPAANNSQDIANTSERIAEREAPGNLAEEQMNKAQEALSDFCRHGLLKCETPSIR